MGLNVSVYLCWLAEQAIFFSLASEAIEKELDACVLESRRRLVTERQKKEDEVSIEASLSGLKRLSHQCDLASNLDTRKKIGIAWAASVPVGAELKRTTRESFSHSGCAKNGARAKRRQKGWGWEPQFDSL